VGTRGSLNIGGKRYYISSDSMPDHFLGALKTAYLIYKKRGKGRAEFLISILNSSYRMRNWIQPLYPGEKFEYPFEEYSYYLNLKTGKVKAYELRGVRKKKLIASLTL
jgi:hypothetical protein